MSNSRSRPLFPRPGSLLLLLGILSTFSLALPAETATPHPGTKVMKTGHAYDALVARLDKAIKANGMGIVARASATLGAKSIGVKIPGNMVVMVFNPKFAVRMLEASVPAGIEAPLRFYITENADGTATLTYRTPSRVFNPYGSARLDEMAKELDAIFERIATAAVGP